MALALALALTLAKAMALLRVGAVLLEKPK